MNREDIIRMAQEVGLYSGNPRTPGTGRTIEGRLLRFAALVAAAEREACAKIAWNHEPDENGPIETAIRARGEKP